jgi:tRNA (guanine9-N1)-methyltransferase
MDLHLAAMDAAAKASAAASPAVAVAPAKSPTSRKRDGVDDDETDDAVTAADQPLSKNQQKKKRRLEKMMQVKLRRKQQEREARIARATAQGRDLAEERRVQAERQAKGAGKQRRDKRFAQRLAEGRKSFQVCVDCHFESAMTTKEINSLALQLRYCYAANRRVDAPCLLAATSVTGQTRSHLERVAGFSEWGARGFACTSEPLEDFYQARRSDLVYLSSDSEHVLQELDPSKIYIIGGIVDRNRLQRATIQRAQSLQITTAKLPLDEYLQKMPSTRVLTTNHTFAILMHYREHKSWEQALTSVLPQRKGAQLAVIVPPTRNGIGATLDETTNPDEKPIEMTHTAESLEQTTGTQTSDFHEPIHPEIASSKTAADKLSAP